MTIHEFVNITIAIWLIGSALAIVMALIEIHRDTKVYDIQYSSDISHALIVTGIFSWYFVYLIGDTWVSRLKDKKGIK